MIPRARYNRRGMIPDPARLAEAHHIKRNPLTCEISWPPAGIERELVDLGLITGKEC